MSRPDAPSTRTLWQNIGHGILALTAPLQSKSETSGITYQDEVDLGKQVDGLIQASVKAALPGRQNNAQVRAIQQQARQAFARKLARRVAKLG